MNQNTPEPSRRLVDVIESVGQVAEVGGARCYHPLADLKLTSREVVVFIDVPGMDEDDFSIEVEKGELVVTGVRDFDHDSEDAEEFLRIERPYGRFCCRLALPCEVDFALATAKYKRGVLKVRLPKPTAPGRSTLAFGGY